MIINENLEQVRHCTLQNNSSGTIIHMRQEIGPMHTNVTLSRKSSLSEKNEQDLHMSEREKYVRVASRCTHADDDDDDVRSADTISYHSNLCVYLLQQSLCWLFLS